MKQDKQPRRASKPEALEPTPPASDMGKRAKGGDKFSNPGVPRRMKGTDQTSVAKPGGKASR